MRKTTTGTLDSVRVRKLFEQGLFDLARLAKTQTFKMRNTEHFVKLGAVIKTLKLNYKR